MASQHMKFYVTEKLGKKQSLTPEGFLLCEDVPLCRTGMLIYGPNETPIEAGPEGYVKVFREEDEVFHPKHIASYQGKPVTMDHPEEEVSPENWKTLAVGTCINPRRGVGLLDDLLLADLLITDPDAIKRAHELPEVSCGYNADYEETGPGMGRQRNILGNHIALVENGRCGPRCAISDHSPVIKLNKEKDNMATKTKKTWFDRALAAFHSKDEAAMEEILKEKGTGDEDLTGSGTEGDGDTHIHIHANGDPLTGATGATDEEEDPAAKKGTFDDETETRFASLEAGHAEILERLMQIEQSITGGTGDADPEAEKEDQEAKDAEEEETKEMLKDEAPEGKEKEAVMAKDSAYLVDSYKDVVATAEILVPGIRIPTFDRAAAPGTSVKAICALRRQALDLAYVQPATRPMMDDVLAGKKFNTTRMSCDAIRTLFNSVGAVKRQANNTPGVRQAAKDNGKGRVQSLADINRINAERYNTK